MGDGVYALTADMNGVDLANNFAVVADANDTSPAKAPGWTVSGSNTSSSWRMTLDAAGNMIVGDWSDENGGIKYAAPDLATGGLVLVGEGGTPRDRGRPRLHRRQARRLRQRGQQSRPVGHGRRPLAVQFHLAVGCRQRHQLRSAAGPGDRRRGINGQSLFGGWIFDVNGVRAGNHYSPEHDLWYLVQNRDNGSEAGIFVVDADETGFSPTLLWDSLSFSNDPNDDFDPADAIDGNTSVDFEGIQDVFRNIGDVTLSPDGTQLFLQRIASRSTTNPFEGGAVIVIPLDAEGVPDIEVSGGAHDQRPDDPHHRRRTGP